MMGLVWEDEKEGSYAVQNNIEEATGSNGSSQFNQRGDRRLAVSCLTPTTEES